MASNPDHVIEDLAGSLRVSLTGRDLGPDDLVREALAGYPAMVAERLFPAPLVPAAVLVGIVDSATGGEVLLTRRTAHLRDHPGQISFPGGRLEPGDADPKAAAVRETHEELGIGGEYIDVVGCLPPYAVVTGFAVSPVVAVLRAGFVMRPAPDEVAEVLALPLADLLRPDLFQRGERSVNGITLPSWSFPLGGHTVWGATAHILHTLSEYIHAARR